MKACTECAKKKSLEDFPPDKRRKDGRGAKCRNCARKIQVAYYARYPEKERIRRQKGAEASANWYRNNREALIERTRWRHLQRKYGISRGEYETLLLAQRGVCAICGTSEPGRKNWNFAVEHDHTTGRVRGLTCHPCNVGLGVFKDSPALLREAANYLEGNTNA
jgi:hypothetical protein